MSTIVKFNNKILRLNNKTVGWTAPVPPPVLYHVITNAVNGTVVATPSTGYNGDTITLSNTPDEGYEFDSYSLTGATLYDTNKFDINNSDVNVVGNFIFVPEPVYIEPVYISDITIEQSYASWRKYQFEDKGTNYNSSYNIVSNNMPSEFYGFLYALYDASGNYINYGYIDGFTFNMNDTCTQSEYNNMSYYNLYPVDSSHNVLAINMPADIKLQLLS